MSTENSKLSTENNKMSTKKGKLSTKSPGRPKKEETKVYSKRVPTSRYGEIKINVDKYIENLLNYRKTVTHYKRGCKVLISLFDDFFKADFPGYLIDKLVSLLKSHEPDIIQEIKEEFIHE